MSSFSSVLLIEDNPGDARLVTEYLGERFGDECEVLGARTLAAGLETLRNARVDLVLLDLCLPDSTGLDTFYQVHAQAPRTPVVILTGDDNDEQATEALRVGAEDYLAKKHADSVALIRTMQHAVQRRHAAEALRNSEASYRTLAETICVFATATTLPRTSTRRSLLYFRVPQPTTHFLARASVRETVTRVLALYSCVGALGPSDNPVGQYHRF